MDAQFETSIASEWLDRLNAALGDGSETSLARLFEPLSYWRDLLAFTGDIATVQSAAAIADRLAHLPELQRAPRFVLQGEAIAGQLGQFGKTIEGFLAFDAAQGPGRGYLRLIDTPDGYRALTLLTTLDQLRGFPERRGKHRLRETMRAATPDAANWLDRRIAQARFDGADPEVLIVGAGQAGLALGARLGQLDVPTLIVDRMERVGDNWRKRYHSLTLHNEICTNHLPYMPFPETWPIYLPKDMLAGWLEAYAMAMELNVWTATRFVGADYDAADGRWIARVERPDGTIRTLRPRNLVLAIGASGLPNIPRFSGLDTFAGLQLHSSRHTSDLDVAGKAAVVIGAGTSAHDIAQDLHMRGARVTMVQRSPTTVISLEPASVRAYDMYRRGEGMRPTEATDLMSASIPYDLLRRLHGPLSRLMQADDAVLLDGLRRAGFLLDNGEDDTGFFMKLVRYLSGYYINVGASDLIVAGDIKVLQGAVDHVVADGVVLNDGTRLPADVLVMATGYKPLQEAVRAMLGAAIADRVGPVWGLGPDDELRNMWRRTAQPGLFIVGGTLTMCRIYSKVTALLIKSDIVAEDANIPHTDAGIVPALPI